MNGMFYGLLAMATLSGQTGDVAGQVRMGPMSPVQKVGEKDPPVPPEMLKSCKVVVLSADGKTVVAKIELKPKAYFRSKLKPGEYLIRAELSSSPKRMNDPVKIVVKSGETTRIELHVDTGIR